MYLRYIYICVYGDKHSRIGPFKIDTEKSISSVALVIFGVFQFLCQLPRLPMADIGAALWRFLFASIGFDWQAERTHKDPDQNSWDIVLRGISHCVRCLIKMLPTFFPGWYDPKFKQIDCSFWLHQTEILTNFVAFLLWIKNTPTL